MMKTNPFWRRLRAALRRREPPPAAIFQSAWKHQAMVSVSFVDRRRSLHNVECRIHDIRKGRVNLELVFPLRAALLERGRCALYFKLPPAVLKREFGIRSSPGQNGFLCRSSLIPGTIDARGDVRDISVEMPRGYTRRELRRHERYRVFSGQVDDAGLWIPARTAPGAPPDLPGTGRQYAVRLVDISAGGAKAILEDVEFFDEFTLLDESRLLLRLSLNLTSGERLDTFLLCRCVSSSYSIRLRRLTLLLQFLSPCAPPDHGAAELSTDMDAAAATGDEETDRSGIAVIRPWLAADYERLTAGGPEGSKHGGD